MSSCVATPATAFWISRARPILRFDMDQPDVPRIFGHNFCLSGTTEMGPGLAVTRIVAIRLSPSNRANHPDPADPAGHRPLTDSAVVRLNSGRPTRSWGECPRRCVVLCSLPQSAEQRSRLPGTPFAGDLQQRSVISSRRANRFPRIDCVSAVLQRGGRSSVTAMNGRGVTVPVGGTRS